MSAVSQRSGARSRRPNLVCQCVDSVEVVVELWWLLVLLKRSFLHVEITHVQALKECQHFYEGTIQYLKIYLNDLPVVLRKLPASRTVREGQAHSELTRDVDPTEPSLLCRRPDIPKTRMPRSVLSLDCIKLSPSRFLISILHAASLWKIPSGHTLHT